MHTSPGNFSAISRHSGLFLYLSHPATIFQYRRSQYNLNRNRIKYNSLRHCDQSQTINQISK